MLVVKSKHVGKIYGAVEKDYFSVSESMKKNTCALVHQYLHTLLKKRNISTLCICYPLRAQLLNCSSAILHFSLRTFAF